MNKNSQTIGQKEHILYKSFSTKFEDRANWGMEIKVKTEARLSGREHKGTSGARF